MLTMTSFVHGVTSITLTDPEMRASATNAWGTRKLTIHTDTGVIEINLFAATSLHTLVQMVGAGLGTTFLPQMAIDAGILDNTDLVAIPLPGEKPYREIGLVWRPSTTRVQTFYKIAELLTPLITPKPAG